MAVGNGAAGEADAGVAELLDAVAGRFCGAERTRGGEAAGRAGIATRRRRRRHEVGWADGADFVCEAGRARRRRCPRCCWRDGGVVDSFADDLGDGGDGGGIGGHALSAGDAVGRLADRVGAVMAVVVVMMVCFGCWGGRRPDDREIL